MLNEKEVRLVVPKSLLAALWLIAVGLVLNGLHVFGVSPVNANNGVQKVAICDLWGTVCADLYTTKDYEYWHLAVGTPN